MMKMPRTRHENSVVEALRQINDIWPDIADALRATILETGKMASEKLLSGDRGAKTTEQFGNHRP